MFPYINTITITGRLGKDAEIKSYKDGEFASLFLLTSKPYFNKQTNRVEYCDRMSIGLTAFGDGLVAKCRGLQKGQSVFLTGTLAARRKQDGSTTYGIKVNTITAMPFPKDDTSRPSPSKAPAHPAQEEEEDDIPF